MSPARRETRRRVEAKGTGRGLEPEQRVPAGALAQGSLEGVARPRRAKRHGTAP